MAYNYRKKRSISVTLECFVKKGGKYLMLCRSPNKKIMPNVWMAPGGKCEFNEGLFEAARREIKEETGLEIKNTKIKVIGYAYLKDLDEELYLHMLVADYAKGRVKNEPDNGKLVWLTPSQIKNLDNLLVDLRPVLSHVLGKDSKVLSYKTTVNMKNEMESIKIENP